MMRSFSALVAVSLLLTACAGFKEAQEYHGSPIMRFTDMNDNWRIFDKPSEGRLMVTTSLGRAASLGFTNGPLTGGGDYPKSQYQGAASGWLASTGRDCTISDGYVLVRPQWEFKYACR